MYSFDSEIYTREDLAKAFRTICDNARPFLVNGNSGYDFGENLGQHSPEGTLLEGWSRMLWGLVPYLAGGFEYEHLDEFIEGFRNGPDKDNAFYWGKAKDRDQRFVETAAMALMMLIAKEHIWDKLDKREQNNLYLFMNEINNHVIADNNWVLFRVLVNMAFEHVGLPYSEDTIEKELDLIDSYYVKDGWYRDKVPFDYYNPWGIHFYMLLYYAMRKDRDPERCEVFRKRTMEFAKEFQHFFNEEGGNIAFGRSLTYRFCACSYFGAAAFAGIEVLPWGVMKGIVMRNLRWWLSKPIFDNNGILTVGYLYPTHVMQDQYNAPGSPYWALKSFIVLALSEDHPFWKAKEEPMNAEKTRYLEVPSVIMCHTEDDDTVMLNNGQNPPFRVNQCAAKYQKFAYSIHRGFSGDLGGIELCNLGVDNQLLFSEIDEDYWRMRLYSYDLSGNDEYLRSTWYPMRNVKVVTFLIPSGSFHVRVHVIDTDRPLRTIEGGFPIPQYQGKGHETKVRTEDNFIISYPWGFSSIHGIDDGRKGFIHVPMSNANMNYPVVHVPALEGEIDEGRTVLVTLAGEGRNPEGGRSKPDVSMDTESMTLKVDGKEIHLI